MSETLLIVDRIPVAVDSSGAVHFVAGMTIDADGAPTAYHPKGSPPGLDYLANAGRPGNWWGIATRKNGVPFIQGPNDPAPGYYVSTTSYKHSGFAHGDPRREVDSSRVAFIVVPPQIIRAVPGIVLGCRALIVDLETERSVNAVVADVGPRNHLGEASMFAATCLGLSGDPKRGGSHEARFHYFLWPGVPAAGFRLQPSGGAAAAMERVGDVVYRLDS